MKVYGGNICGQKHQASQFDSTGTVKGSYAIYVCTLPTQDGRHDKHYDNVHNVHF